jgi:hypothetical protein
MEPPIDADVPRSELSVKAGEIGQPHRNGFRDQAMSYVEFRLCIHRRTSAVTSPFSN